MVDQEATTSEAVRIMLGYSNPCARADSDPVKPPLSVSFSDIPSASPNGHLPELEVRKDGFLAMEPIRAPYDPVGFVGRRQDVDRIAKALRNCANQAPPRQLVYVFIGPPGQGKSWLLSHLAHLAQHDSEPSFRDSGVEDPVRSILVDFAGVKVNETGDEGQIISLIDKLQSGVSHYLEKSEEQQPKRATTSEDHALRDERLWTRVTEQRANTLVEELKLQLTNQTKLVFLLMFDTMEQAEDSTVRFLSQQIIEPLIGTGRVIVACASRREVLWRSLVVRVHQETIQVGMLEEPDVAHLAETRGLKVDGHDIYDRTLGHPILSMALVQTRSERAEAYKSDDQLDKEKQTMYYSLSQLVREATTSWPQEQEASKIGFPSHDELIEIVWQLSILRRITERVLIDYLKRVNDGFLHACNNASGDQRIANSLRRYLIETGLLVTTIGERGEAFHPDFRRVLGKSLEDFRKDKWKLWHEKALDTYSELLEKYQANASLYVRELVYHGGCLPNDNPLKRKVRPVIKLIIDGDQSEDGLRSLLPIFNSWFSDIDNEDHDLSDLTG